MDLSIVPHLVGIFLDDFTYHSFKIYELEGEERSYEKKIKQFVKQDHEHREHAALWLI